MKRQHTLPVSHWQEKVDFWKPLFDLSDWQITVTLADLDKVHANEGVAACINSNPDHKVAWVRVDPRAELDASRSTLTTRGGERSQLVELGLDHDYLIGHELSHATMRGVFDPLAALMDEALNHSNIPTDLKALWQERSEQLFHDAEELAVSTLSRLVTRAYREGVITGESGND